MTRRIPEFLRFCLVGGLGFVSDAGLLEFLARAGFPVSLARLCSMLLAMQVTYLMHSLFTFRHHAGYSWRRWILFMATNLIGGLVNFTVFITCFTMTNVANKTLHRQLALLAGTAVALLFNYRANPRFVFPKHQPSDTP